MSFKDYLYNKKIDAERFKKEEPALWSELEIIFDQLHPKSFTSQKLYLINPIRRRFPWHTEKNPGSQNKDHGAVKSMPKMGAKPQMKPKTGVARPKIKQDPDQEVIKSEDRKKPTKVKPKIKPKLVKPKIKPKEGQKPPGGDSEKKPKMAKPIIRRPKKN